MAGQNVQLRRVVTVAADKIVSLQATTAGGVVFAAQGSVAVGDYSITDATGTHYVLSEADFARDYVPQASVSVAGGSATVSASGGASVVGG